MGVTFATAPEPVAERVNIPEPKKNEIGASENVEDLEPIENREQSSGQDIVLEALGIDDIVSNMPESDQDNLREVKKYVLDVIKSKGLSSTTKVFKDQLEKLRFEMEIDPDTEPSVVLDRIGGIVKAWKGLGFISDPKEKRALFMKLARQGSSREMHRLVFEEMEKRKVWR